MTDVPAHRERFSEPRPGDKRLLRSGEKQSRHLKSAAEIAAEQRQAEQSPAQTGAATTTGSAGEERPAGDAAQAETTGAGKRRSSKEAR